VSARTANLPHTGVHCMQRRAIFLAFAGAVLAGCGAPGARANAPSYRVPLQQLQDLVAQRFPRRYPVAGLFEVSLEAPRLHVLPDLDRLGCDLPLLAAGPALRRRYAGEVALDFGLRYEASDQTIRAHHLRVEALRMDGLTGPAQALLEQSVGDLVRQQMLELVLHKLRPNDLALADTMGLQPGAIHVTWDGLVVEFVNKPPA
jgi:hypothetical protein